MSRSALDAGPGLYVHLPWCVQKCPYCDFNSHEWRGNGDLPARRYTDALLIDLAGEKAWPAFDSVFFGGGTPSLFPAEEIARVLDLARTRFGLSDDAEITLEANPGTVERGDFCALADAGINRISLGAQSFSADALKRLGRIHSPGDIARAVDEIAAAGIERFNIDLMFGLPGQSVEAARDDVDKAIALRPPHISYYQLTLEPNTLFHAQPPALPDDDVMGAIQDAGYERLANAGFEHYEVSAFGRGSDRARHNLNYWRFGDYLGIGAGAHGKRRHGKQVLRSVRTRHPAAYMEAMQSGEGGITEQRSAPDDLVVEYAINLLRLTDEPLCPTTFERRTGVAAERLEPPIHAAIERGLLETAADGQLHKTPLGRRFLNDLQALFLPNDA